MSFKTLKQIADELKIDKQKVYRFVKKNNIKEVNANASPKQYDETAQSTIKAHFSDKKAHHEVHQETHQKHIDEALFDALLKQLEEKDKQINELQRLVENAQKLHAIDKQRLLELECKSEEVVEENTKKKWWKIF